MKSFLEKTVDYLYEEHGEQISDLCIVLPNRRGSLFFKAYLAKRLRKPIWTPPIYSSEDFVALLSGLQILDPVSLLFELYEVYRQEQQGASESFDEFSKWGQILLHDFNEVDRYLIPGEKIFSNIGNIKEVENWSLNAQELTDFQKAYLKFWNSLSVYYKNFTSSLIQKNKGYQGLAYKIAAENITHKIKAQPWKKIIFAGFNALNKAEERIFQALVDMGRAEVLWDSDSYYTANRQQEAGKFIRRYKESWYSGTTSKDFKWEDDHFTNGEKNITVIGVAKNVTQAKLAGDIISQLQADQKEIKHIATVLADENLLFPLLHSLPETVDSVNVTMGYPLKNTPITSLVDLLFNLHDTAERLGKKNNYYYKDVVKLMSHPYVMQLTDADALNKIIECIHQKNIVFMNEERMKQLFAAISPACSSLLPLFKQWNAVEDPLACVYFLIDSLKDKFAAGAKQKQQCTNKIGGELELEYLLAFSKIIKRIRSLLLTYPCINTVKTLRSLIFQVIQSTTLPFYGEPLMGLQVMGMLETRTLDFENVILLSVNENLLPSGKTQNSFIPYDIKKAFGLPTYNDKDAVFAYHFYRLIQRAKNIYILYNTEADLFGSGEKSRFITQLLNELPRTNKQIRIQEKLLSLSSGQETIVSPLEVKKTKEILDKIEKKGITGFSPSLLNVYKNCSLQFYFQALAGLRETEEVEEVIAADTLGIAVHKVLEELYTPCIGKNLSPEDIRQMQLKVEEKTMQVFRKIYGSDDVNYGKNFLILRIAVKFIAHFLKREMEFIKQSEALGKPLVIHALEKEVSTRVSVNGKEVHVKGKLDRVDGWGSHIRIIDYKTGHAADKELKVTDWETIRTDKTLNKSFQLLVYALMYRQSLTSVQTNIQSGVITFRELSAGYKTVSVEHSESLSDTVLKRFEDQLSLLLAEIYNPEIPFRRTDDIESCQYCNFKIICDRQ